MRNATEIRKLAESRLEEAKLLLENNHCEGALYLSGYAIELILKARIVEVLDVQNLFDDSFEPRDIRKPFYSHKFKDLMFYAGLKTKFDKAKATDPIFFNNWSLIEEAWSENCRYKNCGDCKKKDVEEFINAIEDSKIGIKKWIENQ
jgi:hypothetical protein